LACLHWLFVNKIQTYKMRDHNPKNAISLKNLKIRQIRRFFPGVAVFPNLGTNYPEVGPLEKNTSLQRLYSDSLSQYD